MDPEKVASDHVEAFGPATFDADTNVLTADAQESAKIEHDLSPWQAIQAYPMAVFWCLVVSTCVIMQGYDQILVCRPIGLGTPS